MKEEKEKDRKILGHWTKFSVQLKFACQNTYIINAWLSVAVDSIESPYVRMRDVPCVPDVPLTPEGPEKEEESVIYMSMFDYMAQNNDELELRRGSLIRHVSKAWVLAII